MSRSLYRCLQNLKCLYRGFNCSVTYPIQVVVSTTPSSLKVLSHQASWKQLNIMALGNPLVFVVPSICLCFTFFMSVYPCNSLLCIKSILSPPGKIFFCVFFIFNLACIFKMFSFQLFLRMHPWNIEPPPMKPVTLHGS